MARRSSPITVTSKWVLGGEGTLRDAIPLNPYVKLTIDLLLYLVKHPVLPVLTINFIFLYNHYQTYKLQSAIIGTLMAAVIWSLARYYLKKQRTKYNQKRIHKTNQTTPTIPLDVTNNLRATLTLDRSTLIGGESGSGKSNMVWKIISGLNTYDVPHRLHVIDPAGGVELDDLQYSPYLVNYVDRAKNADQLIRKMRDDMDKRLQEMKEAHIRKVTPTETYPLNILIVDELLLLSAQLRQGVSSPLGEILAVGRKAGYIVIACTQLGQVDTIGRLRDLFPQRICFAVRTSDMTDAILGTYATRDGAQAHLLNRPGEGYVFAEDPHNHEKYFERFRSELITDTLAIATNNNKNFQPNIDGQTSNPSQRVNDTLTPTPTIDLSKRNRRTAVYELYAYDGTPMYIGVAYQPNKRFKQHQVDKAWFYQVDLSKTKITWYPTRKEALDAEGTQIKAKRPIYNILMNFGERD